MYAVYRYLLIVGAVLVTTLANVDSYAGSHTKDLELKSDHPERYSVVKGDTLWGIANKFLKDPWRWPEIWARNTQIKNPHLIYPGDVLVMTRVDGVPTLKVLRNQKMTAGNTVRLSPAIRVEPLIDAIPTIPPNAISPFLISPRIIEETELRAAPHVIVGVEDNIVLGKFSRFFARGLTEPEVEFYQIFRPGRTFRNPETQEILGFEAVYLGAARLIEYGETSTLEITESTREVTITDRLLPLTKDIRLPHFQPTSPSSDVRGQILQAEEGVSELGPMHVVVISLGAREGLIEGNVLRIMRYRGKQLDPLTREMINLPDTESGLMMTFKIFEKLSYGLVLTATRAIHVYDVVQTP